MSNYPRTIALLVLFAAASASAQTEQSLVIVANQLDASYDTLLYDVEHAGSSGHTALIVRFDNLEVSRADLHEDREGLEPCGCTQLDPLIAGIDATSGAIWAYVDDWDYAPAPAPERQPLDRSARSQPETQP